MTSTLKRIIRTPRAMLLARRTQKWLSPTNQYRAASDVPTLASRSVYRRFITHFQPKKIGRFTVQMRKAAGDALLMIAITRWIKRRAGDTIKKSYNRFFPSKLMDLPLTVPSNPFKMKFNLTSTIEPALPLPIDRNHPAAVCVVMGWQGPAKRKYAQHWEYVKEVEQILGQKWGDFLLRELIEHARNQGMQAVALLRPEHNPDLSEEHWQKAALDLKVLKKVKSQFYAAGKKAGFKKVPNSKYLWLFFK